MKKDQSDLSEYRVSIDRIDRMIIELLEERFDVVRNVVRYKQRHGLPVLDARREQEKLDALGQLCSQEKHDYTARILEKIMEESRRFQEDHPLRYGLLGWPLGHSLSPEIHGLLGDYEYGLYERDADQLDAFFDDPAWKGINVTMPYKRDVMAYCDSLSETAQACGSVNTIVRTGSGTRGYNTDYDGFRYIIGRSGIDVRNKKTLILGSGGVSGTVRQALEDLGADPVIIISRSGADHYGNLDRHADAKIIVNATPVGMFPKAGRAPVDLSLFPACEAVYDLIYNPLRTQLMLDAEKAGIPAFGGLPMLVAQAAQAIKLFDEAAKETGLKEETGGSIITIPEEISFEEWIDRACRRLRQNRENIVLIGMPGAGKTTTGRALAEKTGMPFLDLDEFITAREGRSPEEIIRTDGADAFRRIETDALREAVSQAGRIIASGGGIVEREENRDLIRQNGRVIWLIRNLEDLPLDGRPISQAQGPSEIYARRRDAYAAWSDHRVEREGAEAAAQQIISDLQLEESADGEE